MKLHERGKWQRVSKARPCPICGRPDWCLLTGPEGSPTAAICARVESAKPCGAAGWLHRLRDDWRGNARRFSFSIPTSRPEDDRAADFERLASRFRSTLPADQHERFAGSLGLTAAGLTRLAVGWSEWHRAYSFPMRAADGRVVGIRLRRLDGRKFAVRGGKEGLFLPEGLEVGGRLIVTEGPTDCASLLDVGLPAVGRPSCSGGVVHLVGLVKRLQPAEVAILADSDSPGQRGAENLASVLVAYVRAVRLATPPAGIKDARAWRIAGATAADVVARLEAAPMRRLVVSVNGRGGQ